MRFGGECRFGTCKTATCSVLPRQDLLALEVLHVEVGGHLPRDGVRGEALALDAVVEVTVDTLHAARERRRTRLQGKSTNSIRCVHCGRWGRHLSFMFY